MRYFLCFLCPPLAVLSTGRPFSFILSIILSLCFWVPGIIYAILITSDYYENKRYRRLIRATKRSQYYR